MTLSEQLRSSGCTVAYARDASKEVFVHVVKRLCAARGRGRASAVVLAGFREDLLQKVLVALCLDVCKIEKVSIGNGCVYSHDRRDDKRDQLTRRSTR